MALLYFIDAVNRQKTLANNAEAGGNWEEVTKKEYLKSPFPVVTKAGGLMQGLKKKAAAPKKSKKGKK